MLPYSVRTTLLKRFRLEKADPKSIENFLNSFENLSTTITFDTIMKELSQTDKLQFEKLLDEDETSEKAILFAKQKIPDLETKIADQIRKEVDSLHA